VAAVLVTAGAVPVRAAAPGCWDYAAGGWDPAGSIVGPGPAHALALTADGRLLAGYDAGVGILDLADPAAPVFTGFLPTEAPVVRLAASGDRVLALTTGNVLWYGLAVEGLAPEWGDSLTVHDGVDRIALDGGTAALVIEQRALLTIDVSDPKDIGEAGFVIPPVSVLDVALARGLAYVGTSLDRFYVYDVSDPHTVRYLGSPLEGLVSGTSLAVRFPTVYAAGSDRVYTYDVSDPTAPVPTGRSDAIATVISRIAVAKDRVYALTRSEQAVMFADPGDGALTLLGHATLPSAAVALVAQDDHLYAATADDLPLVYAAGDARHPGFDRQDSEWRLEAEDFSGVYGYAVTGDGLNNHRLEVLAVGDGSPFLERVGSIPTIGTAVAVAVREPIVAMSSSENDLTLFDVSDPALPRYAGISSYRTVPRGLLLIGQAAYVANNTSGLVGFDISNPAAPRLAGQATMPRTQVAWSQAGDYALIGMTGDYNGMFVVDCHRPESVEVIAWVSLGPVVADVLGHLNCAYVADRSGAVHVFDLTDAADPRPTAVLQVGEGAGRLAAWGRHVYYVDAKQGVVVLDAVEPVTPTLLGHSLVPLDFSGIQGRPDGVLLSSTSARSRLPLPCDALSAAPPPPAGVALTVAPNPANPRAFVSFTLPVPGPVRLTVHDLRGRMVAVLLDDPAAAAGPIAAAWDGRDAQGRAAASGVYLVRLEGAAGAASAPLTLLR